MIFKNLVLRHYRNIKEADLIFSDKINIFIGKNGQGKTNIIESLFLIARGESFRFSSSHDYINFNSQGALVKSLISYNDELVFNLKLIIENHKKNLIINDKKISFSNFSKKFKIILFSPESLNSIKEGPEQRRNLIDELVFNILSNGPQIINDYKKVLKVRNKILRDFKTEKVDKITTLRLLESVNPMFLNAAALLTASRVQCIQDIIKEFNNAMSYISNTNVNITVDYQMSGSQILSTNSKEIAQILNKRMLELNLAELSSGGSLVGPHKHDILFLYNQKDSRIYCSQGQQRALILSFKIAQIVYHKQVHGVYPVLMLDDVMSELDIEKQTKLVSFLSQIKTQIFITTTDIHLPEHLEATDHILFEVKEGNCVRSS